MSEDSKNKAKPIAIELAKKQREISIAEFFEKNRHLLGFDNKRKALLTTIKEAVDNSLDACEEANVLPELSIEIINMTPQSMKTVEVGAGQTTLVTEEVKEDKNEESEKFRVIVEDNGPGIVKKQIPNIFAKLLYGSKFHRLRQARGQQGIGISAAALYGQLTTGKPIRITSKIGVNEPAHYYELKIDTERNAPDIIAEKEVKWEKGHGTRIEIDLEASYMRGGQSVDNFVKQTAIINPHATIIYTPPDARQVIYARATDSLPKEAKEVQPHPYGVELGRLIKMLENTESRTLQSFLTSEFSRVGPGTAKEICENASLLPSTKPSQMTREMAEKLESGIRKTKIMAPPTDCISPIGAEILEASMKKEIIAEFYTSVTRPPSVYRGNPFVIEAGIAYGGQQEAEGAIKVLRFANRVPLLYQPGACAITKAIVATNWRSYGLNQSRSSLPVGPCTLVVHMASVWVPFTSESKEAIAHYPEILKEIRLALQECGRKLSLYVGRKIRMREQVERANIFERYIPIVSESIASLSGAGVNKIMEDFKKMIKKPEIQEQVMGSEDPDDKKYLLDTSEEDSDE